MAIAMTTSESPQKINKKLSNYGNTGVTQTRLFTTRPLRSLQMASAPRGWGLQRIRSLQNKQTLGTHGCKHECAWARATLPFTPRRPSPLHNLHLLWKGAAAFMLDVKSLTTVLRIPLSLFALLPAEDTSLDCHPNGPGTAGVPRWEGTAPSHARAWLPSMVSVSCVLKPWWQPCCQLEHPSPGQSPKTVKPPLPRQRKLSLHQVPSFLHLNLFSCVNRSCRELVQHYWEKKYKKIERGETEDRL